MSARGYGGGTYGSGVYGGTALAPVWQTVDIESSADNGASWIPVRGWTGALAFGDQAVALDYEAAPGVPMLYRARATRLVSGSGGQTITGPWVVSAPAASWNFPAGTNESWLKDPERPERNMLICIGALPTPLYDRTVGVYRIVGARFPVVVSDVMQAGVGNITVMTSSKAEEDALETVLEGAVLLFQSPDEPWGWGSVYVALGAVTKSRTGPVSKQATRIFEISLVEVAAPADT